MYEAVNKKDWDKLFSLHSENHLRYDTHKDEPMKGLEGYRKYIIGFAEAFPDLHIEVVRAFGQGDMVCDEHITSGTQYGPMMGNDGKVIPPSGRGFRVRNCHIYRFDSGKIVETWRYLDQLVFLSQLGLSR